MFNKINTVENAIPSATTVLISGGTGLIGSRLSILLAENGYRVIHLSRRQNLTADFPAYQWDVERQTIDLEAIAQADALIHLAGANVGEKRWTAKVKRHIVTSRTQGIQLLATALQSVPNRLRTFLGASAVGIYGNSANRVCLEDTLPPAQTGDTSFLSQTTRLWEASYGQLVDQNPDLRMVLFRIGIVLASNGGALPKMSLTAPLRVVNYLGNGSQIMPWIHIDDLCHMLLFALKNPSMRGVFNAVAPNPVSNRAFAQAIPQARRQRALVLPVPAFVLHTLMGETAQIALHGCNPSAQKIQSAGFEFVFPDLLPALRHLFA